jgi:hypothetical protein
MGQQPDMILLVGDYVHTHHGLPYLRRAAGHTRAAGGVRRAGQPRPLVGQGRRDARPAGIGRRRAGRSEPHGAQGRHAPDAGRRL